MTGLRTTASRLFLTAVLLARIGTAEAADWQIQRTPTKERLHSISVVSARVAWASGGRGTILRTVDGGETWRLLTIPESKGLDFRDIHATSERAAIVLSIGPGEQSSSILRRTVATTGPFDCAGGSARLPRCHRVLGCPTWNRPRRPDRRAVPDLEDGGRGDDVGATHAGGAGARR